MKKLLLALVLAGCGAAPSPEGSAEEAFCFNCLCTDYKHCTSSSQCPSGQYCYSGDCRIYPMNTRCESYQYDTVNHYYVDLARNAAGDRQNCLPYVCNPSTGSCGDRCTTTLDCAPGFACDVDGTCSYVNTTGYWGTPSTARPDREATSLCSNACGDRAGKAYETCYNGYWLPSTTRCYDNASMLYYGSYYVSCGHYACNWVRGYCNSACGITTDCAVGYTCDDPSHVCY